MKKTLLFSSLLAMGTCMTMAAVPEGDIYLLGLNGDQTPSETNKLVLLERNADDIDDGLWRWEIPAINIEVESGTLTVGDGKEFSLGFNENNLMGFTNELTSTQSMLYLSPNGPAVNYNLKSGEYAVSLALFEDLDGDMGGDSWLLQVRSTSSSEDDETFYLVGFNGTEGADGGNAFRREAIENEGEVSYIYTLSHYYVSECPDGFSVLDAANSISYGVDAESEDAGVTADAPMAMLVADGKNVKCSLPTGYYDVNFSIFGAMAMISFIRCEDQTPQDELTYYLVGLNGIDKPNEDYKFTRTVETGSYTDEDTGETVEYTNVTYTLANITVTGEEGGIYVMSEDETVVFGYNAAMSMIMPNEFSETAPFAIMAVNGPALNCTLPEGKYDFSFSITGIGTGMLAASESNEGSVGVTPAEDGSVVYYDLQGRRIQNPSKGIYVVKQGSKVSKIAF